ncbi:MAG: RluA family pseudouridine synthase [Actinomycetota bacterium]|nr:RluA family pseudouridine synthase [Actinomycetota bacterium]
MSERFFEHRVLSDEAGTRLDKLLAAHDFMPSRSAAARLIDDGFVRVDGEVVNKKHMPAEGALITVEMPLRDHGDLEAEHIPLDIRFEDQHMIVLSKQADLVVHPAHGHWTGTLVHALLAHSQELGTMQGDDRPGIVHRLDKDTTGLMMVAKTDRTQTELSEAIKIRSIDRRYLTLVHGYIAPDTGLIDAPLARDPRDRLRMAVVDHPRSKQAVTTFRVLERFMAGVKDDGFTLIECKLYTGRTHQIRVHMAYIDHPVVGDQLYGARKAKADMGLERQFLHSYRLKLDHPITGEEIAILDPLPEDLATRLESLEEFSMGRTSAGDEVFAELAAAD